MRGTLKIFTFRGIGLFIHWSFLLLIAWVLLLNAQLGNNVEQLTWSLLFVLAIFACVTLHEFGHALTARRFGIEAKQIVLLPIGGVASIERFPASPTQELLISLSGPLLNLAMAIGLRLIFPQQTALPEDWSRVSIAYGPDFLLNLYLANIAIFLFNMIPAFPLDGGRVLRALLAYKLNYIRATTIVTVAGKVLAALLIAVAILTLNPWPLIVGIFIMLAAGTEENYLRIRELVGNVLLKDVAMHDYHVLQNDLTIKEAANVLLNNHSKYFVLMDGDRPAGAINRMEIIAGMAEMHYSQQLRELKTLELETLNGETEVQAVLGKISVDDEKIFPVLEQGHFSGVVSLNHIIEYLLLHKANTGDYKRMKSLAVLLH